MTSEQEWVQALGERLREEGRLEELDGATVQVGTGARLPYSCEVIEHDANEARENHAEGHMNELLLYDQLESGWWVPRVVIECKLGEVNSQDAQTFSVKAARHKDVHSYLRCGVLIGGQNLFSVPPVLAFRHGDRFDFIASWSNELASETEWALFTEILREEVRRSRSIQELFTTNQDPAKYSIVHRQLTFK